MSKTMLTKEQEKEIIEKYLSGRSKNSLHAEYKVSEGTIKRALLRNKINIRQVQETNVTKYKINHDFFDKEKINSDSAYILGLLASDGNVEEKGNGICLELKSEDIELLKKVNKILENEREIKSYSRESRNDTSKLYFFSRKIKSDLAYFDIVPNKTYKKVNFIKNIPDEFFIDFIRGYFDGDGSILDANHTVRWQIDSVSLSTLKGIQNKFLFLYGIELKIRIENDVKSKIPKYRLYCYSKKRCKKIFELLYRKSSNLKLDRKYYKFLALISE